MPNFLVLLRHGQSQWNLENRFTGFKDVDLTENGVAEAKAAGAKLAKLGVKYDNVFSSTQTRANRTAKIALEEADQGTLVANMVRHDDLRERDYGDLTGMNKDEARDEFGEDQVHIWRRSYDIPPPNGESLKDVVEKRTGPYFDKNIRPLINAGKNILIAAHGNSLRSILISIGAETPDTILKAELATGIPLVFEMENGKIVKRYFLD